MAQVAGGLNRRQVLIQLQKDLLAQVLGKRSVSEVVPTDAEHHALIFVDHLRKSAVVALTGSPQRRVHPGFPFQTRGSLSTRAIRTRRQFGCKYLGGSFQSAWV